jgi:NAD(P)-dependent dehydrogenase (short-subunit alcohol dehydrogenase family)
MKTEYFSVEQHKYTSMNTFKKNSNAIVFGASGGIGSAILDALNNMGHFKKVFGFSRTSSLTFDLTDEASLKQAVDISSVDGEIRLVIDATGFLHSEDQGPEKTWRELNADQMTRSFTVNAIGPALLMKHSLPKFPRSGKAVFATLSARVGSISDNHLGGWYAYRASKAALNQIVRTAAIELKRRAPDAICVAIHPGTVLTPLSAPFAKQGLNLHTPSQAANNLLAVVEHLASTDNGGFFDWQGTPVPW